MSLPEIAIDEAFRRHNHSLKPEERQALEEMVLRDGCRDPLVVWQEEGLLLDGHNRFEICQKHGLPFKVQEISLPDRDAAEDWIDATQLARRNLTPDEFRLYLGRRYNRAKKVEGRPKKLPQNEEVSGPTAEKLASEHGVSRATVERAGKYAEQVEAVENDGVPELADAMRDGRLKADIAADVASLPREQQAEIVAKGEREILARAKEIRAKKAAERRGERLEKIAEISKGNQDLDTGTRYPVIYADPPWRYENPPIGASNRSIENHYPTMTLEELCALPVADMAADNAMLYMWATAPKLPECLAVVEAWGFTYRTHMVWDKVKIGMGYHARNQHELLLICKRGEIPPPQAGTQPPSIYQEARGAHSAKPHFFYEMIEAAYPGLPKVELFCRTPRDGWAVWGNQSGAAA